MAYEALKTMIQNYIYDNGNEEITGLVLQDVLIAIVNSLGSGYQFMGVATPSTDPGSPTSSVFYITGTAGTYINFGGLVVAAGEFAVLKYNGSWSKEVTGAATIETEKILDEKIGIPIWSNVNLSSLQEQNCSLGGNGWYNMGTPSPAHIAIPVTPGEVYMLTMDTYDGSASGSASGWYVFVTNAYNPPYSNDDSIPKVGDTNRYGLQRGESIELTVPETAAYLILTVIDGANKRIGWTLKKYTEWDGESIMDRINEIKGVIGPGFFTGKTKIDLSQFTEQNASLKSDNKWYYQNGFGKHIAIPVTPGESYQIYVDPSGGVGVGFYGFVTSSYNPPYADNSVVPYVSGESSRYSLYAGFAQTITAPDDAAYLILCTRDGSGARPLWELYEYAGGATKNVEDRIEELTPLLDVVNGAPTEKIKEIGFEPFSYFSDNLRIATFSKGVCNEGDVFNIKLSSLGSYQYGIIVISSNVWGEGTVISDTGWLTSLEYTKVISAAESGNYIRVSFRKSDNSSLAGKLSEVTALITELSLKRVSVENMDGLVQYVGQPSPAPKQEGLSQYTEALGSLGGSGWWIDSSNPIQRHIAIPVEPGQKVTITRGVYIGYWTFCKRNYAPPTAALQTIPHCTTSPNRYELEAGGTVTSVAPEDAAYLILTTVDGGGLRGTWSVDLWVPTFTKSLFELIDGIKSGATFAPKINVLSWNIGHFALGASYDTTITRATYEEKKTRWRQAMNDIHADIVLTCEYNTNFINAEGGYPAVTARDAVFNEFVWKYAYIGSKPSVTSYMQTAIFSNKELEGVTEVVFPQSVQQGRYYQYGRFKIGENDVYVAAIHLDWNQGEHGAEYRAAQIQKLISDFADKDYVILGGDFNTNDGGTEFEPFIQAGYVALNHGYLGDIATYPAGESPEQFLDNILVKGFTMNNISTINDDQLTDHLGVFAELTLIP